MNIPTLIIPGHSVTVMLPGKTLTAMSDNPKFKEIIAMIGDQFGDEDELESLFDLAKPVREYVGAKGRLSVENGAVYFDGVPVHNYTTEKILQFMELGLPVSPIVNFLERLLANPSKRAVEELYRFLVHRNMPLTHDGKFRAYKGVRSDYKDKYTGTVSHHIGAQPTMLRNSVDDDARNTCSSGFHAGSLKYATDYAGADGRLMVVEIDPADVVSVPVDCEGQKLRTCRYLVVDEIKDRAPMPDTYIPAPDVSEDPDAPFADDPCVDCGDTSGECDCECQDCGEHPNNCGHSA
jgi:hypothetical protein